MKAAFSFVRQGTPGFRRGLARGVSSGVFGAFLAAAVGWGCATSGAQQRGAEGSPLSQEGWAHAIAGDAERARRDFTAALAAAPEDPFARYGRLALAFEHGDTEAALDDLQLLLADADRKDAGPWTRWLANAAAVWLDVLMFETSAWQARWAELMAIPGERLPWPVRLEWLQALDDTARRMGQPERLVEVAQRAHCPRTAVQQGSAGRRPVLDLRAPLVRGTRTQSEGPVQVSGCRVQVPSRDGLPGVVLIRSELELPEGGAYDVVLDYRGLAALRVDEGPYHAHGSTDAWGPHHSAMRVTLAPGRHTLELRLSTYGGGAEYWLAAFHADAEAIVPKTSPEPLPLHEPAAVALGALTRVQVARLEGRWHEGLRAFETLRGLRTFALGLVESGRFALADPTAPDNVTRDRARSAFRLAIERDPAAVRARLALSSLESLEGRTREATLQAQAARKRAPRFWPAALAAHEAFSVDGLEHQADEALDAALAIVGIASAGQPPRVWGCPVLEAAFRRARQRDHLGSLDSWLDLLNRCDARDLGRAAQALDRGMPALAAQLYAAAGAVSAAPHWQTLDHAQALATAGQTRSAMALVEAEARVWARDPSFVLRLANLHTQQGDEARARAVLTDALQRFPGATDVRQAARALGVPLPIDGERVDGLGVIRRFLDSDRRYDAPAVFVLDRLAERVFPDGTRMLLTHGIVRVQSKEALDRWGEVNVPAGAEVLTLRTVKADLTVREPEDIFGKESVSAPELEPGDFVEWETLETVEPSAAFAPGFLGQRFYFQSNEAPLDLSEYLVVLPTTAEVSFDRRAQAPAPLEGRRGDGLRTLYFVARQVPQVFPERAADNALQWIPSVRLASQVDARSWAAFVAERLSTIARPSPQVEDVAAEVLAEAGGASAGQADRAAALVAWTTKNIEAEGTADEPATFALARGRGNRLAVALALGRALGVRAEPVMVRPLSVAAHDDVSSPEEVMSFSEVILYFPDLPSASGQPGVFVDLRLRHAPFGYVPPGLDGARALNLDGVPRFTSSLVSDRREVDLRLAVALDGGATLKVSEHLVGSPAIEWAEALEQIGADEDKRQRRFEDAYLAHQFPGAELQKVSFDVRDGEVHLNYEAKLERLASVSSRGMTVEPRFFVSQPGRRFATEPTRATTLLVGPDVPLVLNATVTWPAGFRVIDAGEGVAVEPLGPHGPRFVERRTVSPGQAGSPAQVVIHRESRVPLLRVSPSSYAKLSASLRKVDAAEQSVIRVVAPDAVSGGPARPVVTAGDAHAE